MPGFEWLGLGTFLFVLATFSLVPVAAATPDPQVAAIVREVHQSSRTCAVDSYEAFFSILPTDQGAQRGYSEKQPQRDLLCSRAAIFKAMSDSLAVGGGTVSYQDFDAGKNIVGVLPGQGPNKSQIYVIGSHYDSEQNPGADDNASGVAGLLQAAYVLARHKLDATLAFVAFDQEEERSNGWAQGSKFYADSAKKIGADIRGVVVLDMIAYNHGGKNIVSIGQTDTGTGTPSSALASKVAQAFQDYTKLTIERRTGFDDTDGQRFYEAGFPSMTVMEQLDEDSDLSESNGDPLSPYYHESSDYYRTASGQPQMCNGRHYLDFAYATEITKGVVAWAAIEARVLAASSVSVQPAMRRAEHRRVLGSGI